MKIIPETDLIVNPDGSIFHLHLRPEEVADTVILVGDPGRVMLVSDHFDSIEVRRENREFVTHTGYYRGKRFSALSTGIGTDNIDIVLNELDALANVDLEKRIPLEDFRRLDLIRLGTSGALQASLIPGSIVLSEMAGGFDAVYHYYLDEKGINHTEVGKAFMEHVNWKEELPVPYFIKASEELARLFSGLADASGITISSPGFYAPQMRSLRLKPFSSELIPSLSSFRHGQFLINNFEMECSALYALASMLGHRALTLCVAIANRVSTKKLDNYKPRVDELIKMTLDKLSNND